MKVNTKNIVWFTKPTKEEKLTATLGKDEKLRISEEFQNKLPENIQFGFDDTSRILFIAEAIDSENRYKKRKSNAIFGLAKSIIDTGLKLPACFEFSYDSNNRWWAGQVVLRRKNSEYDTEQILALYKPLADKLVGKIGKTTPAEDRRQIINLAFCEGAKEYTLARGDFEKFLIDKTKCLIKPINNQYVKYSNTKSLDASLVDDSNGLFNLYSCLKRYDEDFIKVEDKIMLEQFEKQLTEHERNVFTMLSENYTVSEIAEKLEIAMDKVEAVAKSIALKRKYYYS